MVMLQYRIMPLHQRLMDQIEIPNHHARHRSLDTKA